MCLQRLAQPALLLAATALAALCLACGAFESTPPPTPTPTAAESLGLEIAETYGMAMLHARIIVDLRPTAPEARELLRILRDEFKLQLGNYGCLRDSQSQVAQAEIAAAFDANRDAFLPPDMSWFEDAASDYDLEDAAIRGLLLDIEALDDYAFLERVAESRPGESVICDG